MTTTRDGIEDLKARIAELERERERIANRPEWWGAAVSEGRAEHVGALKNALDALGLPPHENSQIARAEAAITEVRASLESSRAVRDALGRACMTLRLKVEKYLKVSEGEEASDASWDAWEDMRIALGAFATNDEVRDWEAELFAVTNERDTLRAELMKLKPPHQHRFITDEEGCVHPCECGATYKARGGT